ncbi:hypothetical protein J2W51_002360 [Tardiphaga robiniae]|uniref:hypothetical protein n=1 Tax=Tardiphaga robiniae TaxID=943830 RepID=UPI002866116A|nr:hypothetical protein [Tardiphaga robiniae]MDR6659790.1 hypothetical protein [Tardiphaga robiniae]
MPSQDYLDGFEAARRAAEKIAKDEATGAETELGYNLAPSVRERTLVRKTYAEKIALGIRSLEP